MCACVWMVLRASGLPVPPFGSAACGFVHLRLRACVHLQTQHVIRRTNQFIAITTVAGVCNTPGYAEKVTTTFSEKVGPSL